ncbi:hypothetical protein [Sphingomonas profundi]|uniref:hypothetical protein n=1 Tax=Alterirhizorhabdus profundi TaxID=2681549 RepID=UPI0012E71B08|nr:hypothetical protein [Sphingomonas profundi]
MIGIAPDGPEWPLVLVHVPPPLRPAFTTLFRLDRRLGAIVGEPNRPIAAIKLAWWRETLDRLDTAPPPPEPLLQAIATELLHRAAPREPAAEQKPRKRRSGGASRSALNGGIGGGDLAAIAAGWDALIDDDAGHPDAPDEAAITRHAATRGGGLFGVAARLLGCADAPAIRAQGAIWAFATVPDSWTAPARTVARREIAALDPLRWPRKMRALGVLTALARDGLMRENVHAGSPRRVARALWLGLSGR